MQAWEETKNQYEALFKVAVGEGLSLNSDSITDWYQEGMANLYDQWIISNHVSMNEMHNIIASQVSSCLE